MKKTSKATKMLSLMLSFMMVLSLFSVTGAITASADVTEVATADAFLTAVNNGGSVQLTADFTLPLRNHLEFNQAMTLDLNGHTITVQQTGDYCDWGFHVPVTITDGAGGGKVINPADHAPFYIPEGGGLTLEGGTLELTRADNYGLDVYGGPFTMTGGTINSANFSIWRDGGKVTISGGTIIGGIDDSEGELEITGGKFNFNPTRLLSSRYIATKEGDYWVVSALLYPLWVGGEQVTSANAEDTDGTRGWSYTPATESTPATPATLTLNGATISGGNNDSHNAAIYAIGELNINVTGDNTVTGPENQDGESYGIRVDDDQQSVNVYLNITGSGTLTSSGSSNSEWSSGITTWNIISGVGDITIGAGTTVNAVGQGSSSGTGISSRGDLIVSENAKLTAAGSTNAIDGKVKNAVAGTGWTNTDGTEGKAVIEVSEDGQTLNDYKKVQFPTAVTEYPLWVGGEQVTSENAEDTDGTRGWSYTPATEGDAPEPAVLALNNYSYEGEGYNNAAIYTNKPLTIEVTGTNTITHTAVADKRSFGIYNGAYGEMTITGTGTLTVNSGDTSGYVSNGIFAAKLLTIDKDVTVKVNSGKSTYSSGGDSYGVDAHYGLHVKGTLEAAADTETVYSYGIYTTGNDFIVYEGGTITATGQSKAVYGKVKNAIAGTGWTNTDGTEGEAVIEVSEDGQLLNDYKLVKFPEAHVHKFTQLLKWVWDGFKRAIAWIACETNPDHVMTIDVPSMIETFDNPDCTTDGYNCHVATIDIAGTIYSTVNIETVDQLGHEWSQPEYTWAPDPESGCKAVRYCLRDGCGHFEREFAEDEARLSYKVIKDATCEEDGIGRYTAKFNNEAFETQTIDVVIPKKGHMFLNFVKWVWDGFDKAIAYLSCDNDPDHIETVDVPVTIEKTVDATCEEDGYIYYTATIDVAGVEYSDTKIETIDQLGHDWGDPEWTWSDDCTEAYATFTCRNDSTHTETAAADVTSETTPATTEADGKTVYTAKVTFNGKDYEDTKTVVIPKLIVNEYVFVNEGGIVWTPADGSLTLLVKRTDGQPAIDKLVSVTADGYPIAPGFYTVTETADGLAITFAPVLLAQIITGEYTIAVNFTDGSVETKVMIDNGTINGLLGDVNGDGQVDSTDALLILRNSVDLESFNDAQMVLGDVNFSDKVDSADALAVLRYSVGFTENPDIGKDINSFIR